MAEKNGTLFNGSEPSFCGAVKVTGGLSSIVYVDTGIPYLAAIPTGPYTNIEGPSIG